MLKEAAPTLASLNMDETVAFYTRIGFTVGYHDEGYAIVQRDAIQLHFWKTDNPVFPQHTSCYLYVEGVDALYAEMQAADIIHPNAPLKTQPWGMREFAILDVHGNLIRMGESG